MIVFGLPGSGVSSTANTILGKERMKTVLSFDSVTETCRLENIDRFGYKLKIVDVPGFDADISRYPDVDIFGDLKNGINLLTPGPNVFLLITPVDRYNADNNFLVSCLQSFDGLSKYIINVFTKVDKTNKSNTREIISKSANLRDLLSLSDRHFLLFDNMNKDIQQVKNLMDLVKQRVDSNEKKYFDTSIFSRGSERKLSSVVAKCNKKRKDDMQRYKKF